MPENVTVPLFQPLDKDSYSYTFFTPEMAQAFVKAVDPLSAKMRAKLSDKTVVIDQKLFWEILRNICGPIFHSHQKDLSAYTPTDFFQFHAGNNTFYFNRVVREESAAIIGALKNIGIKNLSASRGIIDKSEKYVLVYIPEISKESFDFEKLAQAAKTKASSVDLSHHLVALEQRRNEIEGIIEALFRAEGWTKQKTPLEFDSNGHPNLGEKEFHAIDYHSGHLRVSVRKADHDRLTQFSQNTLKAVYGYDWDPERHGEAYPQGGSPSSSIYVIDIDRAAFFAEYSKKHGVKLEAKDFDNSKLSETDKSQTSAVATTNMTAKDAKTEQKHEHLTSSSTKQDGTAAIIALSKLGKLEISSKTSEVPGKEDKHSDSSNIEPTFFIDTTLTSPAFLIQIKREATTKDQKKGNCYQYCLVEEEADISAMIEKLANLTKVDLSDAESLAKKSWVGNVITVFDQTTEAETLSLSSSSSVVHVVTVIPPMFNVMMHQVNQNWRVESNKLELEEDGTSKQNQFYCKEMIQLAEVLKKGITPHVKHASSIRCAYS